MRRKLVKLGPTSLTMSLPKDWIERFGLKAGDEVEIEFLGTKIVISSNSERRTPIYEINFESDMKIVLHDVIVSMYKAGLTDVIIKNLKNEEIKFVKEICEGCIGFEIISSEPGKIRITDLGKSDEESLIKAEEQIYWKLLYMIDQILDKKSVVEEIRNTDREVNKLSFFIERNLRGRFSMSSENFLRYEKIVVLESLGDSLRSYKIYTKNVDKEFIMNVGNLIEFFRSGKTQLSDFVESRKRLNYIQKYAESNRKKDSASVLSSILIIKDIRQIFETILALSLEKIRDNF